MSDKTFELIVYISSALLVISSFIVFWGSEATKKRICLSFLTAFLGGFTLVFGISVFVGISIVSGLLYAIVFGIFSAGIFVGGGFLSRKQRDWVIRNAQNRFQKTWKKHEPVDVRELLRKYRSGAIELDDLVSVLEPQQYWVRQNESEFYAHEWNKYKERLEITSAELAYGEIPRDEILEHADQQVQLFLEFIEKQPD